MEEIRNFVDEMITWAGVTGDFVPMLRHILLTITCLLYTFDAADEEDSVDLGGRRIITKYRRYAYLSCN